MFGLSNPLNAMQILFINILMDGESMILLNILLPDNNDSYKVLQANH